MTATLTSITLSEWETLGPDECVDLCGRFLDGSTGIRHVVERLTESNFLGLTELRRGLQVKAFSHVGRVRVGDLSVTILPKIKGPSLLSLVRYAYGFRRLNLISDSTHLVDHCGFEDLLISQLNAEVQELISRGLLRAYIGTSERLSSPRGRIDLTRIKPWMAARPRPLCRACIIPALKTHCSTGCWWLGFDWLQVWRAWLNFVVNLEGLCL